MPHSLISSPVATGSRVVLCGGQGSAAEGPVALPPFGHPLVRAVASDYRTIRGVAVPFRLVWPADGKPLADERVRAACVLATPPPAAAFTRPGALPDCD